MEENKMVEALESLIIYKAKQMQTNGTSPEEIEALAELVKAVNQTPRTLKAFD